MNTLNSSPRYHNKTLAEDDTMEYLMSLRKTLAKRLVKVKFNYINIPWFLVLERHCCKKRHILKYPELKKYTHHGLHHTKRCKYVIDQSKIYDADSTAEIGMAEYDLDLMMIDNPQAHLDDRQTIHTMKVLNRYIKSIRDNMDLLTICNGITNIMLSVEGFEYSLMRYFDRLRQRRSLIRHRFIMRLKEGRGM